MKEIEIRLGFKIKNKTYVLAPHHRNIYTKQYKTPFAPVGQLNPLPLFSSQSAYHLFYHFAPSNFFQLQLPLPGPFSHASGS